MLDRRLLVAFAIVSPFFCALGARAEQASRPLDAVFLCYQRAHAETRLDTASVDDLCRGAADDSPVTCYLDARRRTFLSSEDALSLCRCATSSAPVACYVEGHQTTTLAPDKILSLCAPTERLHLDPDCLPPR